jgi:hypothetical protein
LRAILRHRQNEIAATQSAMVVELIASPYLGALSDQFTVDCE